MDIFDFITQEEIDTLPEEPKAAFAAFTRAAARQLAQVVKENEDDDQRGWQTIEDARYGFANVVTAAAKRYSIQPFADYELAKIGNFSSDDYRQYRADLDHYLTQIILEPGRPKETTSMDADSRDRLRSHLGHLKTEIERSTLQEKKKRALLQKLADFERELENRRISMTKAANLAFTLLGVPGSVWASSEVVHRLTHNVVEMVGQAQQTEEELSPQLHAPPVQRALSAPRPVDPQPPPPPPKRGFGGRETFPVDLDDEIPF